MCLLIMFFFFLQFVHEKELGAEDDQVFLLKLQVRENVQCIFVQLV